MREPASHAYSAIPIRILSIFAIFWLLLDALILPPSYGGLDIYYFKDPGANLAQGLGFASRFTYGNPHFNYDAYAQYPPLYPPLWGIFADIFGVSLRSNQVFNSLVNIFCGLSGYHVLRPLIGRMRFSASWKTACAMLVLAACLVTAYIAPDADRPDALAVGLILTALLLHRARASASGSLVAGALAGTTFFISPFVCIWGTIGLAICIASPDGQLRVTRAIMRRMLFMTTGGIIAGAFWLSLIALALPGWFDAFSGVLLGRTTHNETGGGYFMLLLHGDIRGWASAFAVFTRYGVGPLYINLLRLLIVDGALILAMALNGAAAKTEERRGSAMLLLIALSPLCLILTPYQFIYIRITALLVLAAAGLLAYQMPGLPGRRYGAAVLLAFGAVAATALPRIGHDTVARVWSGASLRRAVAFIDAHRSQVAAPDRLIAVSPAIYMLWRQEGVRPLNAVYSGFEAADARNHLAYVALGYSRSDQPEAPERPAWFDAGSFRLLGAPRLPQVPTLLGHTLQSGSATWESSLYMAPPPSQSVARPSVHASHSGDL